MASQSSTPPSQPPKESFARRYKFIWPMLLAVNVAAGGTQVSPHDTFDRHLLKQRYDSYLFVTTEEQDSDAKKEVTQAVSMENAAEVTEKPLPSPPVVEPVKAQEPILENQQRELFKWILEEKRKVKPKDLKEQKKIDEEKAIINQCIRAKSIPRI